MSAIGPHVGYMHSLVGSSKEVQQQNAFHLHTFRSNMAHEMIQKCKNYIKVNCK